MKTVRQHPKFWHEIVTKLQKYRSTFKNIEFSYLISWYAIAQDIDKKEADIYFDTLLSGLGIISEKDPIYLMRQFLIEKAAIKNRTLNFAMFVKSWNLTRKKQTTTVLRYANSERYPIMQ